MAPPRVVGAVIDRLNVNKQLHAISEGLVNFYVASHVLAMLGASVCLSVCHASNRRKLGSQNIY